MCDEVPPCKTITSIYTYKTEFNADSVEWCPHEPSQNVFVCANYQLKDNNPEGVCERIGRILLFSIAPEEGLVLHQTIDTEAVLDQKWCHNRIGDRSILGVVNAKSSLEIYALNAGLKQLELVTRYEIIGDDTETLLLSLDWSTGKYQLNEPEIVCSDSKGRIHRFSFANNELVREESCQGHEFEAWIAGFYYWDPNIIFSGGDDSCFLKFDRRAGTEPVVRNRSHEAGVTSLHSNARNEFIMATGSYDENVRLWDIRHMKSCTNSVKMPGTLWRLKWDPLYQQYLLAACMFGGAHVIDATDLEHPRIAASCHAHETITYGADWAHLPGDATIATCSFYDNLLCVSRLILK